MTKVYLILAMILVFVLVSCVGQTSSESNCNVESYLATIDPIMDKWYNTLELANETSAENLREVITTLQELKRETSDLEVQDCLINAHSFLVRYQEGTIDAYIAYVNKESDEEIKKSLERARADHEAWMMRWMGLQPPYAPE
jgi:hypothetical protein